MKAIEVSDESSLLSVAASHNVEDLPLKRNRGATGSLVKEEIGADFERAEVDDGEKGRRDERDLQESEAPVESFAATKVPEDSDG